MMPSDARLRDKLVARSPIPSRCRTPRADCQGTDPPRVRAAAGFATWDDYWRDVGVGEEDLGIGQDCIIDPDGKVPRIWFQVVPELKAVKNRLHLDNSVAKRGSTTTEPPCRIPRATSSTSIDLRPPGDMARRLPRSRNSLRAVAIGCGSRPSANSSCAPSPLFRAWTTNVPDPETCDDRQP